MWQFIEAAWIILLLAAVGGYLRFNVVPRHSRRSLDREYEQLMREAARVSGRHPSGYISKPWYARCSHGAAMFEVSNINPRLATRIGPRRYTEVGNPKVKQVHESMCKHWDHSVPTEPSQYW